MIEVKTPYNKSGSIRKNLLLIAMEPFNVELFTKSNNIPGYSKWLPDSTLLLADSVANVEWIVSLNLPTIWSEGAALGAFKRFESARYPEDGSKVVAKGFKFARLPHNKQEEVFNLSKDREFYAFLWEQGTGKTKLALDTGRYLHLKKEIDMMIIVSWPKGVHRNWVEYEVPEDCFGSEVAAEYWNSSRQGKKHIQNLKNLAQDNPDKMALLSFNIESMNAKIAQEVILHLLETNKCLLVIDQSASIKNPTAKRTQFLIDKCAPLSDYRRILDGDPNSEGAHELFSQLYFLHPDVLGHKTFTSFRNEFCVVRKLNYRQTIITGYKNIDRLHRRMAPHVSRVLAEECDDLPPRIYKKWAFSLTDAESKIYNAWKKDGFAEHEGELLTEKSAMHRYLRSQQVSCGWVKKEEGLIRIENGLPSRANALNDLSKQIEGKAIIFCSFKNDVELISDMLDGAVSYYGGNDGDTNEENKREFISGDAKWIVGTHRILSIGHTFIVANDAIFYTMPPSLRFRKEGEKRPHRRGQEKPVTIWDLIGDGTNDNRARNSFKKKQQISSMILNDPIGAFLE